MRAAENFARGSDDFEAIKAIVNADTAALGGARPKATVVDADRILIAKFAHPADDWDVMGWEQTALDMAAAAGIPTPTHALHRIEGHGVVLLDRFDRSRDGHRLGYMSAMTLMEVADGEGGDYCDIAERISEVSSTTETDLPDLWARAAFNAAINNTDDHLRNHGFLRGRSGWALSPAFDLNPNPEIKGHSTTVLGAAERREVLEALLEAADVFGMGHAEVQQALRRIDTALGNWRRIASRNGVPSSEFALFASVLDAGHADLRRVIEEAGARSRPVGHG